MIKVIGKMSAMQHTLSVTVRHGFQTQGVRWAFGARGAGIGGF